MHPVAELIWVCVAAGAVWVALKVLADLGDRCWKLGKYRRPKS